jgi:MFS family permease
MIAFPVVGGVVQSAGWRAAWLGIGVALLIALAPLAWMVVRPRPESMGLRPDGDAVLPVVREDAIESRAAATGFTLGAALATPAFWVFAVGAALYGLVASGIGLFNESILAERGFTADVYYQTLAVTAITALAGNFLGGWLAGWVSLSVLMASSMFVLAGGLAALPLVSTIAEVMAWASAMGLGGGLVMVLFFSVWPRVYGRPHLGRIQGTAQAVTVVASALGPLLLAWCVEWTGSYRSMFQILAVIIGALGVAALVVRVPSGGTSG